MSAIRGVALLVSTAILLAAGCQKAAKPVAESPAATATDSSSSALTPHELTEKMRQRRAVEAVIWAMPAVNYDLMLQAMLRDAKGSVNQIVYWSRLFDWKNQTTTPNPDAIYFMPFINTKDTGPMVLEIPPADDGAITGNVCDVWQCALEDVGIAGVDKGKGGKYLVLPPDYKGKVPGGYIVLQSDTYGVFALLRSTPRSGNEADIAKAVAYGRRVKLYPLSQASNPPATSFVDAIDVLFDATIPYDLRFFQSLDRIVQAEPWLERDKAMIDPLRSLGIEKGKPFAPDAETQRAIESAAREAHALIDANYATMFAPYYGDGQWSLPALPEVVEGQATYYSKPDSYAIDARAVTYSLGFIGVKHLGTGQFYLMTTKESFDGGSHYRLHVPANAPVKQYWSATAYDRGTHALIRNTAWSSRSSHTPGLRKNADGSTDIFFGPEAPAGKESNWVPTQAGGRFEVLFRLYGPEKPLFDKTWRLPDVEKVE